MMTLWDQSKSRWPSVIAPWSMISGIWYFTCADPDRTNRLRTVRHRLRLRISEREPTGTWGPLRPEEDEEPPSVMLREWRADAFPTRASANGPAKTPQSRPFRSLRGMVSPKMCEMQFFASEWICPSCTPPPAKKTKLVLWTRVWTGQLIYL